MIFDTMFEMIFDTIFEIFDMIFDTIFDTIFEYILYCSNCRRCHNPSPSRHLRITALSRHLFSREGPFTLGEVDLSFPRVVVDHVGGSHVRVSISHQPWMHCTG